MIKVNMTKAREIKREVLRKERKPLLEKLDVDFMRAQEQNDSERAKQIADKKQSLRDVTQAPEIEAASTPEELKAFRPEIFDNV